MKRNREGAHQRGVKLADHPTHPVSPLTSDVATAAAKGSAASAKTTAFISAKAPAVSAAGGISMCAHHMQPCTRKRDTQE